MLLLRKALDHKGVMPSYQPRINIQSLMLEALYSACEQSVIHQEHYTPDVNQGSDACYASNDAAAGLPREGFDDRFSPSDDAAAIQHQRREYVDHLQYLRSIQPRYREQYAGISSPAGNATSNHEKL